MKRKNQFTNFIKGGLTVLISVLVIFTVVKAGSLTPPSGEPVATFYSLSEIYNFITSNTTSTEGSPVLDWSTAATSTGYTLTEIYSALANLISADKVKIGTTYLGMAGTLYGDTDPTKVLTVSGGTYNATQLTTGNIKLDIPFGASSETGTLAPAGTASTTDCLDIKTFYSGNSWTQKTGSIANCFLEGGNTCYAASGYWTATAGNNVTGANDSLSFSIPNGYYSSKTCIATSTNLAEGNIKNNTTIFGVTGTFPNDGTAGIGDVLAVKTFYSASSTKQTGTMADNGAFGLTASSSDQSVTAGYYSGGTLAGDANLVVGNIRKSTILFGLTGTMYGDTDASEVCSNATAAGTLSVDTSKMLTSATYCGITGNIAIQTLSNTTTTVSAGYYASSTTLDAVDTDLATGNIKSGITIFGVAGDSNVVDTSSGNATVANIATGTIAYVDGAALTGTFDPWTPQWLQTKDDWVNSGGTTGEYILEEATWSAVTGSPFASSTLINYNDGSGRDLDLASGTVKQDTRTGLWWSDVMAVGATATTTNNSFATSTDGVRPTGGGAIGFCDALNTANFGGYNNWYLPTQKELMQAYIDGSANNLPNPGHYFWSSTEHYNLTANAWAVYLSYGLTSSNTKVTSYYVRCVRR